MTPLSELELFLYRAYRLASIEYTGEFGRGAYKSDSVHDFIVNPLSRTGKDLIPKAS